MARAEQIRLYHSKRWLMARKHLLSIEPLCRLCGAVAQEVDHLKPLAEGGDELASENLQPLCRACHRRKTAAENRGEATWEPLVILVGWAGVGKSTIREPLAIQLALTSIGPDDSRRRWDGIYSVLDHNACLLECWKIPSAVRRMMKVRPSTVIELTASEAVRRQRLESRGESPSQIETFIAEGTGPLGYEDHIEPDLTVDTTGKTPEEVTEAVGEGLKDLRAS